MVAATAMTAASTLGTLVRVGPLPSNLRGLMRSGRSFPVWSAHRRHWSALLDSEDR